MNIDKIREALERFVNAEGYKLFEVSYHKKDATLSVLLDETLPLEKIEEISDKISALLDQYDDEFADNYILDVSTVGVERPIRNKEELEAAIGSYIYVKDKEKNEYNGTLKDFKDGILTLQVSDKNRQKEVSVAYENVKKVRYAVKF